MGIAQLIAAAAGAQADPIALLKAKYPQLFANGEALPNDIPNGSPLDPNQAAMRAPDQELPPVDPTQAPVYEAATTTAAPATVPDYAPEPTPALPNGGDTGAPANPPGGHKRGGILGALASVFTPSPDSVWGAALNNPNGLWGARAAQEGYRQTKAQNSIATQTAEAKLKALLTKGEYQVVGNNVFHIKPDGSTEMISSDAKGAQEKLIDRWKTTSDPQEKALIERILPGFQYTPGVISAQGAARTATATAGAAARGAEARKTKAMPGAGGGSGKLSKPPTGFILNP